MYTIQGGTELNFREGIGCNSVDHNYNLWIVNCNFLFLRAEKEINCLYNLSAVPLLRVKLGRISHNQSECLQ